MHISDDTHPFQALAKCISAALSVIMSYNNRAHHKSSILELSAQSQHIHIIGDAQILTHLAFLDVQRTDHNHNLGLVAQLMQHSQLAVGLKARQHTACMMIIEKLASKLKVKFVAELRDTLFYMFGLNLEIFLVIKTIFHNGLQS